MRFFVFLTLLFIPFIATSQAIMSWNIQDLGRAKYNRELVDDIGVVICESGVDIVAIQELVTSKWADKCMDVLAEETGYEYVLSPKTSGSGTEKYAFMWSDEVELIESYLDDCLEDKMSREPFIAKFVYNNDTIILRQVHLVPTNKNPEEEVNLLNYTDGLICGDFNLECTHQSYCFLSQGFNSTPCDEGTTLGRDNKPTNNNYDHFFVEKSLNFEYRGVYLYEHEDMRSLSDHLPLIIKINGNDD